LRDLRLYFQHATEEQFCEIIERRPGAQGACIHQRLGTDSDVSAELFYLEN
jgi:hypothetical protein